WAGPCAGARRAVPAVRDPARPPPPAPDAPRPAEPLRVLPRGRADVDVQVRQLQGGALAPLLTRAARAPDDAGDRALAAFDQDALPEHLLRIEGAEDAQREQAVVADVCDRDADLVDVPDQRERPGAVAGRDP